MGSANRNSLVPKSYLKETQKSTDFERRRGSLHNIRFFLEEDREPEGSQAEELTRPATWVGSARKSRKLEQSQLRLPACPCKAPLSSANNMHGARGFWYPN